MEKALLVTVVMARNRHGWGVDASHNELLDLARSSNIEAVDDDVVIVHKTDPKYFIGSGKVGELSRRAREHKVDVVIFSQDLSGSQQRSLEAHLEQKTIDRTQLILDVFARRARSMEGKVQVELAQLNYLLPRLAGKGIFLSRLGGGIGTRGPGEQKLETDRRRIRDRIRILKREARELSRRRNIYRDKRKKSGIPTVSLVGYTNAGKSTLFNALTYSKVVARDQLFSTLDPKARCVILPNKQKILLVDTVGFLHDLPHHLIEAFKATLEEVVVADLILHVADISHPDQYLHSRSVEEVLKILGCDDKKRLLILNKIDRVTHGPNSDPRLDPTGDAVRLSARTHEGLEQLIAKLEKELEGFRTLEDFFIYRGQEDILHVLYEEGEILHREDHETGVQVRAQVPKKIVRSIRREIEKRMGAGL